MGILKCLDFLLACCSQLGALLPTSMPEAVAARVFSTPKDPKPQHASEGLGLRFRVLGKRQRSFLKQRARGLEEAMSSRKQVSATIPSFVGAISRQTPCWRRTAETPPQAQLKKPLSTREA